MKRLARLVWKIVAVGSVVGALGWPGGSAGQPASKIGSPALPVAQVDTVYPVLAGRTLAVRAGGDVQTALNAAQPGDTVTLEAGATFTGNFTLPKKAGTGWVVIRSSAPDSSLPRPGTRVTAAHAAAMPKLVSPNGVPTVQTAPGAHHYRFVGVEVTVASQVKTIYSLVAFGGDQRSLADTPEYLIVDRCYVHGQPATSTFRGVLLNSASAAVVDSHISEIHVNGFDSQAILGTNGPGPFKIVNNYLEGAGENIMFGGADPVIPNLVPSDIEVRRNHLAKPLSWKKGHPSFAGSVWVVKNLFELKNARRVLVDGNVFENNWAAGQSGFAILFTPRNQEGSAPWSVVEDVTFTNNLVRNIASGVNMQGTDDGRPSQQLKRVLIRNNLFEKLEWMFFQVAGPAAAVVIDHNTGFPGYSALLATGMPSAGFVFTNNVIGFGRYGVVGDGGKSMAFYFPDWRFERNLLVGGEAGAALRAYPAGTLAAPAVEAVGFVNVAAGDYRLGPGSRFRQAGTDGKDVGVDLDAVTRAVTGTEQR